MLRDDMVQLCDLYAAPGSVPLSAWLILLALSAGFVLPLWPRARPAWRLLASGSLLAYSLLLLLIGFENLFLAEIAGVALLHVDGGSAPSGELLVHLLNDYGRLHPGGMMVAAGGLGIIAASILFSLHIFRRRRGTMPEQRRNSQPVGGHPRAAA